MPRRRRAQEARRAERRASRMPAPPTPHDEVEQGWAEHQAWERERRRPRTPEELADAARREQQRQEGLARMWAEVLRARDAVLADFARWEREREQG